MFEKINNLAAATVLFTLLSGPAFAVLGGDEASIAADQVRMKGARSLTRSQNYTLHEIQLPSGTRVREYVSAGRVFAVVWQGPFLPDLQQLLGAHFADFGAAAQSKHTRRGPVSLQQPGLVIESGGHMRAFFGRAYLPLMMPAGMRVDEIL